MGSPLASFTSLRTFEAALPRAFELGQPVNVSATGLRNVMRPSRSAAATPSAMLERVEENTVRLSRRDAVTQVTSEPIRMKTRIFASTLNEGACAAGSGRRKK